MEEVANHAKEFYEIRNGIIKIIKKARKEQAKEDKQSEEDEKIEEDEQSEGDNTGRNWIYGSKDQLKELIKKVGGIKEFNLTKYNKFIKKK